MKCRQILSRAVKLVAREPHSNPPHTSRGAQHHQQPESFLYMNPFKVQPCPSAHRSAPGLFSYSAVSHQALLFDFNAMMRRVAWYGGRAAVVHPATHNPPRSSLFVAVRGIHARAERARFPPHHSHRKHTKPKEATAQRCLPQMTPVSRRIASHRHHQREALHRKESARRMLKPSPSPQRGTHRGRMSTPSPAPREQSTATAEDEAALPTARPAPLQTLYRVHHTLRKNFKVLRRDVHTFNAFTRLCAEVLSEGDVLEQLRQGAREPSARGSLHSVMDKRVGACEGTQDVGTLLLDISLSVRGTEIPPTRAAPPAQDTNSSPQQQQQHQLQLSISTLSWLNKPIEIPDLPLKYFFCAHSPSHHAEHVQQAPVRPEAAAPHAREDVVAAEGGGEKDAVASVLELWHHFYPPSPGLQETIHDLLGVQTLPLAVVLKQVVQLLETIAFFAEARDFSAAADSSTEDAQSLTAAQDHVPSPAALMLRIQCGLMTLMQQQHEAKESAAQPSPSAEAKRVGDTASSSHQAPALAPRESEQTLSAASQEFLARVITKVDRLERSPSAATPSATPFYRAHVLEVLFQILFRYVLTCWPLLPATARASFFRLANWPRFTGDIASPLAVWCTHVALATRTAADTMHLPYVQLVRSLSWPVVTDYRSSIVRRAMGVEPMPLEANGRRVVPSTMSSISLFRKAINVLCSTTHKQRLAYELLYIFLYQLAQPAANTPERPVDRDLTSRASASQAPHAQMKKSPGEEDGACTRGHELQHARQITTLGVCAADVDRFLSERFFTDVQRPQRWLLLPMCTSAGAQDEVDEIAALQRHLDAAVTSPRAITRLLFVVFGKALYQSWPSSPHVRYADLLWSAYQRAVGEPCRELLVQWSAVLHRDFLTRRETDAPWQHLWLVLQPQLITLSTAASLRQALQLRLLEELEKLVPRAAGGLDSSSCAASCAGSRGPSPLAQAQGIFIDLQRLGCLAALFLASHALLSGVQPSTDLQFRAAVKDTFSATTCSLLASCSGARVSDVAQLVQQWPFSESPHHVSLDMPASEGIADNYLHLWQTNVQYVLSAEVGTALREWVAARAAVHQRDAQRVREVGDPTIQQWFWQLQDARASTTHSSFAPADVFSTLWRLLLSRVPTEPVQETAPDPALSPQPVAPNNFSTAVSTGDDMAAGAAHSARKSSCAAVPREARWLSLVELQVALEVLSRVHMRQSSAALIERHSRSPFHAMALAVAAVENKERSAPAPARGAEGDGGGRGPPAEKGANSSPAALSWRAAEMQRSLSDTIRRYLLALPAAALLDAVFVGAISMMEAGKIAYAHSHSNTEGGRRCASWLAELEQAMESSVHTRVVGSTLLVRYFSLLNAGDDVRNGCVFPSSSSMRRQQSGAQQHQPTAEQEACAGAGVLLRCVLISLTKAEWRAVYELAHAPREESAAGRPSSAPLDAAALSSSPHPAHAQPATAAGASTPDRSLAPTVEDAVLLLRVQCLAAYISFRWHDDRSAEPPADIEPGVCEDDTKDVYRGLQRPEALEVLFALFLDAAWASLPLAACGHSEEQLLWLGSTTATVQCHFGMQQQSVFDDELPHGKAPASAPLAMSGQATCSSSHDLRACAASALLRGEDVLDLSAPAASSSAQPSLCCKGVLRYLLTSSASLLHELLPLVRHDVLRSSAGRVVHISRLTFAIVGVALLQQAGAAVTWAGLPLEQLLYRAACDRRLVHRHLNFFLVAAAALHEAGTFFIPIANYLREARDVLTAAELELALAALSLVAHRFAARDAAAMDTAEPAVAYVGNASAQAHDAEHAAPSWLQEGRAVDVEADEEVRGVAVESGVPTPRMHFQQAGVLPSSRAAPPALRLAWSALTRRLLDRELTDEAERRTPTSVFLTALQCGAAVGCVDTNIFSALLASVLFSERVASLGLAEWASVLRVCGSSTEIRAELQVILRDFVVVQLNGPHARPDGLASLTAAEVRAAAVAWCTFVESLVPLFVEGADFWMLVRRCVLEWASALRDWNYREKRKKTSKVEGMASAEMECVYSFNWAVRVAGHHGLVLPVEATNDICPGDT